MGLCVCFFVALFTLPALAQDKPDEIVKAAIAAAGGDELLMKYPAARVVGKGTIAFGPADTPFTFEQAYHLPGRFRTIIRTEVKGQNWEMMQLVNDSVVKETINGRLMPLTDAGLKELQMAAVLNEIGQMTPLVTDKKFTLKPVKQEKGASTAGLLVLVRGFPDVRLTFDKKSGNLIKSAYKANDPDTAKEVEMETTFEDFKTVSGITRPTRSVVTREGKKVLEMQVEKFTPLEKVDPKAFTLDE
jgi:hypothetical protein